MSFSSSCVISIFISALLAVARILKYDSKHPTSEKLTIDLIWLLSLKKIFSIEISLRVLSLIGNSNLYIIFYP